MDAAASNYLIARLSPELTLTPTAGGAVVARGPARVELTAPAVAFLLLVDGLRTIENLESVAASLGMPLPPGFAAQLLGALVSAGLAVWVDVGDIQWETSGRLAHACDGCGRSCQGHLVGPLPDSEVRTIQEIWPALLERAPRLAGHRPLVLREEGGGVFLQQVDGKCLFLDDDNLCAIHRHFSPLHKPSICRMFPYQRVLTEDGVRLGISAACYRHHATEADADPTVLGEVPPIVLDRESYQQLALSGPPAGRRMAIVAHREWEERLAHEPLPQADPSRVEALLDRFRTRLSAAPWSAEVLGQPTAVARGFVELLEAIALPAQSPAGHDRVLRSVLVQMHFVRETEVLGGPERTLALMMLGHHLAARLEGVPHAERLVAWFWLLTTEGSHRLALEPGEARWLVAGS